MLDDAYMRCYMKRKYNVYEFIEEYHLLEEGKRLLNAGSANKRYGNNCVNIDIQPKANVDLVCDIHKIPEDIGKFDAVICNAVLQYCHHPRIVANQFYNILKPGGLIYIDAPWVQPFCQDTTDRFRYSQDALKDIFSNFEVLSLGETISSGTALAMEAKFIAENMTHNKYLNRALYFLTSAMFFPFLWISTANENITAGAFYFIGQKIIGN